ncbi:phosphatidylinositol phosphatase PTPRQ-like isoform X3 [Trichogramma pretiosum]|uniref:phosphatidylinositol phosphatase PTPRQ-like isoform X3 n=1 Tax=Trichogramma pretiosum TaxID=7493 RepID=UPI000C71B67E|nr:phosphatidylinositol phosphatase PTPRQ-like isoform X3 [Trichogramma pretiosum]
MIPRKKLHLLLFMLQISYIFGDYDTSIDNLLLSTDFKENVIDDSFNANEKFSKIDKTVENAKKDYLPQTTTIDIREETTTSVFESSTDPSSEGEKDINLQIADINATFANVSWNYEGQNVTFILKDDLEIKLQIKLNKSEKYQEINNLEPCYNYIVELILDDEILNKNFTKNFTTSYYPPGKPNKLKSFANQNNSLRIEWVKPKYASNCVKGYKIDLDLTHMEHKHVGPAYTNETFYEFENLYSCTVYLVSVVAVDSSNSESDKVATIESAPTLATISQSPVLSNATQYITKNSINVTWNALDPSNNCTLKEIYFNCSWDKTHGMGYDVFNSNVTVSIENKTIDELQHISTIVDNVSPFTDYICQALIKNEAGSSNWSTPVLITTEEDLPGEPLNFQTYNKNHGIEFTWEPPKIMPGRFIGYRLEYTWEPLYMVPTHCKGSKPKRKVCSIPATNKSWTENENEISAFYETKLAAATSIGVGPYVFSKFSSNKVGIPSAVTNLQCRTQTSKEDLKLLDTILTWQLPCSLRGNLISFSVEYSGERDCEGCSPHKGVTELNIEYDITNPDEVFSINLGELKPAYNYTFTVRAKSTASDDYGDPSLINMIYPSGLPAMLPADYIQILGMGDYRMDHTSRSATLLLPIFDDSNGPVQFYAVMVTALSPHNWTSEGRWNVHKQGWPATFSWKNASDNDFTLVYQATVPFWSLKDAEIAEYGGFSAVKYTVGKDTTCAYMEFRSESKAYCNGPLKPNTWYEVKMRAFTSDGYIDSPTFRIKTDPELNLTLTIGALSGILLIGFLLTVVFGLKRFSLCEFFNCARLKFRRTPEPNPMTIRKFMRHCKVIKDNPGKLSNEYQMLQTLSLDLILPCNAACLRINRSKNRYSDILPYDFTRVKLSILDGDSATDYINASYIRGYSGRNEYIACQGPKSDTCYDFWRMICELEIEFVVMLTNLVEQGREKCFRYWPHMGETAEYGDIKITSIKTMYFGTFVKRCFTVERDHYQKTVSQLHFVKWPDHDIPDGYEQTLYFVKYYRNQLNMKKGLSVVHCSAGIGRTGTFIAIDMVLQHIENHRRIDIFRTVYGMRRDRGLMVQRESQYAFIYFCVHYALKNPALYETMRKDSLSTSIDSMIPLCQSSPQASPKILMNGLRHSQSAGAIDTRSDHNRIERYNSEGYAISEMKDSLSSSSKDSISGNNLKGSNSSLYENIETASMQPSSNQTISPINLIEGSTYNIYQFDLFNIEFNLINIFFRSHRKRHISMKSQKNCFVPC